MLRPLPFALLLLLPLAACGDDDDDDDTAGADAGGDAGTDAGGDACEAPTAGPTTHAAQTLAQDETWTAATGPHLVTGDFTVGDGVTLVIEPCVEVRLSADVAFRVDGTLLAEGTAAQTIRFVPADAGARWAELQVAHPGSARLAYVTLEGAGSASTATDGTTLRVRGDSEVMPFAAPLAVDHVTVRDSAGHGAYLTENSGFAAGSTDLTITASGLEDALHPAPVRMSLNAMGSLPSGDYAGNGRDEIMIVGESPRADLDVDVTLHDRGVPYHVGGGGSNEQLRVSRADGLATLTIEPGVTIRFEPTSGGRFDIGRNDGSAPATGVLVAVGTAERPIVFTSAASSPAPGDWPGLRFLDTVSAANRIEHVRVEYAGGDCGCSSHSCGPQLDVGVDDEAAILLFSQPPSAFIRDSTIVHSAAHGISRGWSGDPSPSFVAGNTFEDVPGCFETWPRDVDGNCPPEPPCPR